ncbi:hypothetical protein MOPEL_003_00930 [Mobilicoccus pelagius NBRC 104925]|uniref:O-antigen polymerase family protein n=1 Tax=Mobilicoccus pelagius NBRC 104925 TaxID=1089455 RepID=H5UMW1_9MICO|nr:hypothetical protein MOPEL_003_00930 [Mobilicoccus pelagius NBRC 104925]
MSSSTAERGLDAAPAPTTLEADPRTVVGPDGRRRDPVRWLLWLFVLNIVLQRISVPNISIPLTVPITVLWCLAAWRAGVLVIERQRLLLWLTAAAASSAVALPQTLFVHRPYISVNSWLFWMTMWFPVVFMMSDRSGETYRRMMRSVTTVGLWLSGLSLTFLLTQLVGIAYRDWLFDILPDSLHVTGFAISYPITYGSPIYKSNGWIMLEPSFMSFTLGVCFMTALLTRAPIWKVVFLFLGLLTTVAGSGFAIIALGVIGMLLTRQGSLLRQYVVPGLLAAIVAIPTAIGQVLLSRVTEVGQSNSSAAMRSFEPYLYLIPRWVAEPWGVWVGYGAGASRQAVEASGTDGLIAPTIGKVFYEYGFFAGALLLALCVVPFMRAHERALSASLLLQFFLLQPPAQPIIVPAFAVVTLWAPAARGYIEAGSPGDTEPPPPPTSWRGLRRRR